MKLPFIALAKNSFRIRYESHSENLKNGPEKPARTPRRHRSSALQSDGDVSHSERGALRGLERSIRQSASGTANEKTPIGGTPSWRVRGFEARIRKGINNAEASQEFRPPAGAIFPTQIQDCKGAIRWLRANPSAYVTADDPPFLIVHGDQDPLDSHHQSELLAAALEEAGVDYKFYTVKGAGHGGFGRDPNVNPMVDAFFDRVLLNDVND